MLQRPALPVEVKMDQWLSFLFKKSKPGDEPLGRTVLSIFLLAVTYYIFARLSFFFAFQSTNVSPLWPPSGIALAAVWIWGYRLWPGVFLGAFTANADFLMTSQLADIGTTAALSYVIGIGNTLEAVGGCFLLRLMVRNANPLHSVEDVLKFFFVTLFVCLLNALGGAVWVTVLGKAPADFFSTLWFTWWLGDTAGILTVAPILFVLQQYNRDIHWTNKRCLEAIFLFSVMIFLNVAVFWEKFLFGSFNRTYLLLPVIVWAAYRFGIIGASIAALMTLGIAMAGTMAGLGPFAHADFHMSLLMLFAFVGIISITGLILAAVVKDRQYALIRANENEERFRSLVEHSADMISVVSPTAKILYASPSTTKILGYSIEEYVGRNSFEYIHPHDKPQIMKLLSQLLVNPQKTVYGGCRFMHKDGSWRWMEGSGNNQIADPAVGGIVVNYRDVTDKKKAQEDQLYLASIIENSEDAIYGKDLDGNIVSWNQGAQKIYGYKAEEIIGKPVSTLASQDRLSELNRVMEDLKAGKAVKLLETTRRRKDGQSILVSLRVSPIKDRFGHLIGFSTIARDITERKLAEERYRYIVEAALDGVVSIDENSRIIEWSRQAEKIFGWARKEVLGRQLSETIIPVSFREAHNKGFKRFLQTGEGPLLNKRIEITALHRKGHEFPVELSITPLQLSDRLIFSAFVRDITERKKADAALRESELRFRNMADTAPVMIWVSGRDTLYNFFNKAWLDFTGLTIERGMGSGWADTIHPDDKIRYNDLYLAAFDKREKFTIDYRLRRWDGEYRWILDTGVPRFSGDKKFEGYIGSCLDITERKMAEDILKRDAENLKKSVEERSKQLTKAQEELKKASRLAEIGTLASAVAHELRNPLGVIQMAAFNLKRRHQELAEDRHILNIEKKVWEGERVINNLLVYASIKVPRFDDVTVLKTLEDSVASVQKRFQDKDISVERKYEVDPDFAIQADPTQMIEIFNNILLNAYQAIPDKKGTIELGATHADGFLRLLIKDTGAGIEPEDMNKLFVPFFTKKAKGTGLGLAICNELVHLHNGKIDIASEKEKGTTVVINIPIRQDTQHE